MAFKSKQDTLTEDGFVKDYRSFYVHIERIKMDVCLNKESVYIAAPWQRGGEAEDLSKRLQANGHPVKSKWHEGWTHIENPPDVEKLYDLILANLEATQRADRFVLFASPAGYPNRGGRLVELGVATLKNMKAGTNNIYLIGTEGTLTFYHRNIKVDHCYENADRLIQQWTSNQGR